MQPRSQENDSRTGILLDVEDARERLAVGALGGQARDARAEVELPLEAVVVLLRLHELLLQFLQCVFLAVAGKGERSAVSNATR